MACCYPEVDSEEWFHLPAGGMRIACCDCGLVHDVSYRRRGAKIEVRFARNDRATAGLRRGMKRKEGQP